MVPTLHWLVDAIESQRATESVKVALEDYEPLGVGAGD